VSEELSRAIVERYAEGVVEAEPTVEDICSVAAPEIV